MTLATAEARLARLMSEAEAQSDLSMLAKTQLLQSIISARLEIKEEGVPVHIGHTAIARLHKAIGSDIASAADLFRTHGEFRTMREQTMGPGHEESWLVDNKARPDLAAVA